MSASMTHTSCMMQCCILLLSILIASCGGGGKSTLTGGVGSGGTGVAEGVVSGFGSVIIAELEYDDTDASVVLENASGQTEVTEVKLGQRVRIKHRKQGIADTIQVLPQLIGTASTGQNAQGEFTLLGQTVQNVTESDTQNTATVLNGLNSVSAGDELEVHGNWVLDRTRNYSVLIATRIEKLSSSVDPVLLSGVVRQRNGNVITLDNASGQNLQYTDIPAGLAAKSLMTAWLPRNELATSPWSAIRVVDASPSVSESQRLVLNAQVSEYDLTQGEIRVQGLRVRLPNDNLSTTPLAVGSTVQIDIVREGGEYKTVALTQRQSSNDLGGLVTIKGSLLWPANPARLSLRGNVVTIPNGLLAGNCGTLQSSDRVYLEITAQRAGPSNALRATSMSCSLQIPSASILSISGSLAQFNAANKTLQVETSKGTLVLTWTSSTLLPSNLSSLLNQHVEIEYQNVSGENRLRKLKPG